MKKLKKFVSLRLQSSFELLVTLSFGIAILLPIVLIAFVQLANTNAALSAIESQQAASKLSSMATLVGSEGPPAKQYVQISVPPGVTDIFVGNTAGGVGHEIVFVVLSPGGSSYITSYTPVNVSGYLRGISRPGTYLVNVSSQSACPTSESTKCVYMRAVT